MKNIVLDSYAVIAFLNKEQGYSKVAELFEKSIETGEYALLCVVNLGEVYYHAIRAGGEQKAKFAMEIVKALPIEVIDADLDLTLHASEFKAYYKMSYADAYAAALTKIRKGQLLTGDKEFKTLENEIKIIWM